MSLRPARHSHLHAPGRGDRILKGTDCMAKFSLIRSAVTAFLGLAVALSASSAVAECAKPYVMDGFRIIPAAWSLVQTEAPVVNLYYVGHSTFVIESPAGVKIET